MSDLNDLQNNNAAKYMHHTLEMQENAYKHQKIAEGMAVSGAITIKSAVEAMKHSQKIHQDFYKRIAERF
jgi:hypothetical protein